ncbi:GNAT family N-acetyltransferase [Conyzicola nivalis]|uniref:N-acetyltransferase n=1 Tax=Conyzicola nivalis TaxID=1477021 RepID=A0A916SM63_9MICO|nr:GNAT family N-acetyltransferase [Conyzicola nivalis]GGB03193.1 N-acetyltransferase [Conyzicola nivalis]
MLSTERLLLPPLGLEHADDLVALYSDPEVARYVGGDSLTAQTIPLQAARFAAIWREHGYGQSAVIDRETGEFLGRVGLHYWPGWDEVELGYVLAADAQGRGLAAEAARAWIAWARASLARDHLISVIDPRNAASVTLALRLGFVWDRDDVTPTGVVVAVYRLGLA